MTTIFSMAVYIVMCILQPICLPIPELLTITYGVQQFGSLIAVAAGIPATMAGITLLYQITKFIKTRNSYVWKKFLKNNKKIEQYQNYIRNNAVLITGLLFIIPILPDEIICIGAALNQIRYRQFILTAFVFKLIGFVLVGYSETISRVCGVSNVFILVVEVLIMLSISAIMKKHNGTDSEVTYAD